MIKFIHTGDLHLGMKFDSSAFPGEIARVRREEMWQTFLNIIDLAREKKVDFLFITGDLFEADLVTVGALKRINDAFNAIPHINVVISPGNHDYYWSNSPYNSINWADNVKVFKDGTLKKQSYEELGVNVYGFAWREKYIEEEFLYDLEPLDDSKVNILLLHGDVYSGKSKYLPVNKSYLEGLGFDYIALGHIHKYDLISRRVCYAGSPEPLDFSETGRHGVVMGSIEGEVIRTDFIPMAKREFVTQRLELNPDMSHQYILEKLKSYPNKDSSLYRIILTGLVDSDVSIDQIIEEVEKTYFYVELTDLTRPDYDLDKIQRENDDNIIGLFVEEMKKRDLGDSEVRNALYLGLEALLKERLD